MAGTAYPKRAIKQNRRTTRAKIGKTVKLARMGDRLYIFVYSNIVAFIRVGNAAIGVCTCRKYFT